MARTDTSFINSDGSFDFFFYGTLLVPAILIRVLGHQCQDLTFQDAVLPGYTRHCVKGEDYPAIIGRDKLAKLVGPDKIKTFDEDALSTRGTLVRGLTFKDVTSLDIFEGTQYSRVKVDVNPLNKPCRISDLPEDLIDPRNRLFASISSGNPGSTALDVQQVWTYVWSDPIDGLEVNIWSFEQFLRDKAAVWTSLHTTEYNDVERHRALAEMPAADVDKNLMAGYPVDDGDEAKIVGAKMNGFPDFGKNMLQYWGFAKGYINLNHGSYGSPPKPVIAAMHKLSEQIESSPDLFMRRSWLPLLNKVRTQVAEIIGATMDEVVMVPNATHGINTIMNNIEWSDGDVIVGFSTTYGAIGQTAKYICDRHPKVNIDVVDITFPCSHDYILQKTEEMLSKYNTVAIPDYSGQPRPVGHSTHERVKMVIVDSIASNPGMVYPWEDIVRLCKKYGAFSMVDAAHSIGQHKVDVKKADCDFWVTNCHKWLMSHRGSSAMYIPLRNQHLIRSSFPTSHNYESTRYPTPGANRSWEFAKQYEWTGTPDWTPFMSVSAAIEFRKSLGGEDRIINYTHSLAVEGGKRVATRFGTRIMENKEKNLTAAMVNVELPDFPPPKDLNDQFLQLKYIEDQLFDNNCFAPAYVHAGKWWARFSAQVWNDMSDFDYIVDVFLKVGEGLRSGVYLQMEVKPTDTLHDAADIPTQNPA